MVCNDKKEYHFQMNHHVQLEDYSTCIIFLKSEKRRPENTMHELSRVFVRVPRELWYLVMKILVYDFMLGS